VVLTVGATAGDIVDVVAYGAFVVANMYTKAEVDAKDATKVPVAGATTITGVKTFTSSPVIPDAVNANEPVSKGQLDTKPTGFKNYIINGGFDINQRGYVSGTATVGANEYTLDRWRVATLGEALTFTTAAGITTITAPLSGVETVLEPIIAGAYTLNVNGTATATVSESVDNITYTAIIPNTDGSYTTTGYNYIKINLANGTAKQVQLEEGSVATSFEQRPYGLELSLCQRYFQKSYSDGVALGTITPNGQLILYNRTVDTTGFGFYTHNFILTMRTAPSLKRYNPFNGNADTVYSTLDNNYNFSPITNVNDRGFSFGTSSNVANLGNYLFMHYTADAEL